jgi:hypothetical protein
MVVGIRHADHVTPSFREMWLLSDKRRSLGLYSSLADSDHGVQENTKHRNVILKNIIDKFSKYLYIIIYDRRILFCLNIKISNFKIIPVMPKYRDFYCHVNFVEDGNLNFMAL